MRGRPFRYSVGHCVKDAQDSTFLTSWHQRFRSRSRTSFASKLFTQLTVSRSVSLMFDLVCFTVGPPLQASVAPQRHLGVQIGATWCKTGPFPWFTYDAKLKE